MPCGLFASKGPRYQLTKVQGSDSLKRDGISYWKVAATYIGTIVGAGFATGQEVLQFFSRFGISGLFGLILSTFLFIVFGYIIMNLGNKLSAQSHLEIIRHSGGKYLGAVIDVIITFFLFGALTAMIAGTGALFEQQLKLPNLLGSFIMSIITVITVLAGLRGVINSISFVVPFLLLSVIGISIYSAFNMPPDITATANTTGDNVLISNWLLSAFLYVSYNTVISIAVLGPLGLRARDKKAIRTGSILGGLGLGISSVLIYVALSGNVSDIAGLEVPMIYIAGKISFAVQIIYALILIAEVYTTAVGSLYGFVSRITVIRKVSKYKKALIIGTAAVALLASQFGFSNLVKFLYPLVGYGGIVLLGSLIYVQVKQGLKQRNP